MCVNATTSTYNQTLFDSYVNLLRLQTEAMSAALGSVHSMVVTPFDAPYEEATDFSERIARNQQLLIKEEAHFDRIVDPSAGSYYIEHLTDALATEAWKIFLSSCWVPTSSRTSQRRAKASAPPVQHVAVPQQQTRQLRSRPSLPLASLPTSRISVSILRRPRCL